MARLDDVEGIGRTYAGRLAGAGAETTRQLLEQGASRSGRRRLARAAGVSETRLLGWVNRLDLARVRGIGPQYSDLLEAGGVDSVAELLRRNADHLASALHEVNARRRLVRHVPGAALIEAWQARARDLPRIVTH
ncbi:MAG: DUF4332 domain-containing protein [Gaiellales bacterium]